HLRGERAVAAEARAEERTEIQVLSRPQAPPRLAALVEPAQRVAAEARTRETAHLACRLVAAIDAGRVGPQRLQIEAQLPRLELRIRRLDRRGAGCERVVGVARVARGKIEGAIDEAGKRCDWIDGAELSCGEAQPISNLGRKGVGHCRAPLSHTFVPGGSGAAPKNPSPATARRPAPACRERSMGSGSAAMLPPALRAAA